MRWPREAAADVTKLKGRSFGAAFFLCDRQVWALEFGKLDARSSERVALRQLELARGLSFWAQQVKYSEHLGALRRLMTGALGVNLRPVWHFMLWQWSLGLQRLERGG